MSLMLLIAGEVVASVRVRVPSTRYCIGTTIEIMGEFADETGEPMDVDTAVLTITKPDHSQDSYTAVRDSVGVYLAEFDATEPAGRWWWRMIGTAGDTSEAETGSFYVLAMPS